MLHQTASSSDLVGCCDVKLTWKDCNEHGDASFDASKYLCFCNQPNHGLNDDNMCEICPDKHEILPGNQKKAVEAPI